ncbi:MAG: ferritin-like domain-containing protein [Geodermatophilaceae bacterium]|nr:ferritin-like domain-containing protein [Geodermatophilaceae bacterium]
MTEVDALQDALAGEHAVIWGYGVVGAEAAEQHLPAVRAAEQAHRTRRDDTADLLRSMSAEPIESEAYYELPFPVTDPALAVSLAVHLEEGSAAAWRFVLGQTEDAELRRTALVALSESALQAVQWRLQAGIAPATVAFPGQ